LARDDLLQATGTVEKILGGGRYKIVLESGQTVTAQLSGRMRRFRIRVIPGDRVQVGVGRLRPSHAAGALQHSRVIRYWARVLLLRSVQALDRLRLRVRCARQPGLELHPTASSNLAVARYQLEPGARLRIGAGVVTERLPGRLHFSLGPGALVEIGDGAWLRTEIGELHLVAFEGARLRVGPECLLNGCHLSAKQEVTLGRKANVGMGSRVFDADQHDFDAGSRVFDADQHDFDAERSERYGPVTIGDHVWVASNVTVLRGVSIGEHSIVGAGSLVTRDIPPHSVAFGQPAEPHGQVGDRSNAR